LIGVTQKHARLKCFHSRPATRALGAMSQSPGRSHFFPTQPSRETHDLSPFAKAVSLQISSPRTARSIALAGIGMAPPVAVFGFSDNGACTPKREEKGKRP